VKGEFVVKQANRFTEKISAGCPGFFPRPSVLGGMSVGIMQIAVDKQNDLVDYFPALPPEAISHEPESSSGWT
jgi:hypothetical protein